MESNDVVLRVRVVLQRFWQPTGACLSCMPGNLGKVASPAHWEIALRTGLLTAGLVLLLSFTPFIRVFRDRLGNALVVGGLTAVGDALSHPGHYGGEALLTCAVSGLFALVASWLFEDRARRLRGAWARLSGAGRGAGRD